MVRSFYFINSLVTICKIQLHITINFRREYKIFCVNEKIHTKKEVPSVE